MRLQTQLILSHLFVTIVSVMVLLIGLMVGYVIYLQTDLPAAWTAEWADIYAAEADGYLTDNCAECIWDVVEFEFSQTTDTPAFDEWIIFIQADGTVLGSNYEDAYPTGSNAFERLPFGINRTDFSAEETLYRNEDGRHFSLAPMTESGGWVYFHGGSISTAFQLQQTIQVVLLASVALSIIAVVVSGAMGGWLGYFFGRRLTKLGDASQAFAQGQLDRRVQVDGTDEVGQLGIQFNQMANTISQQMTNLKELADTNARLATESEGLARLEERNRLARELHDAIKQQLFGLNLTLGSLPAIIESKPNVVRTRLENVISETQAIQVELDQIINQMRPASLLDQGLATATRQLAQKWSEQTAVQTHVTINHEQGLPLKIEEAAYRLIQESLQNTGKHAQATRVDITLNFAPTQLVLIIQDNGRGFDQTQVNKQQSFGLQNMRQRVSELEGQFTIKSEPQQGTRIYVVLPVSDQITWH